MYFIINSTVTPNSLQACLSAIGLHDWSEHWQLKLSPAKCTVLHVLAHCMTNRTMFDCVIGDTTLPKADTVTDLGVTYDRKLLVMLLTLIQSFLRSKLILRCFQSRDPGLLMHAFITFVRPILEYCSVVWSPAFKKDIVRIEAEQRCFTKRLSDFSKLSYEQRLASLYCESLYSRRVKCDLVMCY